MGKFFGSSGGGGGKFFEGGRARSADELSGIFAPAVADAPGEAVYSDKLNSNAKDLAQQIHRLNAAGDEEGAMQLIAANRGAFSDEAAKAYGLDKLSPFQQLKLKEDNSATARIGHSISGATQTGLNAGLTALDYSRGAGVGAFRQAHAGLARGLDALPGVEVAGADKTKYGVGQFFTDVKERTGFGDLYAETKEQAAEEGDTTLFGSKAAQDNKWIDRAVGGVGDVALDPLTYVGGAGTAKAALKGIERDIGPEIAEKIAKEGLERGVKKGIISEAERRKVYEWAAEQGRKAATQEAKGRKINKLIEKVGESEAARQIGEETASAVERMGRSGLRFGPGDAKRTILPTSALPGAGRRAFQDTPKILKLIEDAPASEVIDDFNIQATTRAAENLSPKVAGPHVIDMGDGEKLFALRGEDGKLLSYATVEGAAGDIWRNADTDMPVTVLGPAGAGPDGRQYLRIAESATAVPADEVIRGAAKPRVNLLHSIVGGQGNAQKVLKAVQESGISITDVIKNSEFTDEGRRAFKRFVQENIGSEVTRKSAADVLRQTGAGKTLRRAFVPRSEVTDALGRRASDALYEAQSGAAAAVGQSTHNVATQLSKLPAAAAKEFKEGVGLSLAEVVPEVAGMSGKDALNTVALSAIEGRTPWDDVIGAARADGMDKAADALEAFKDVVRQGDEALGASEAVLPRVVSREGAEALKGGDKNLELQELFGISRDQAAELRFGSDLTDAASTFEKRQLTPSDVKLADAPDVRMAVKDLNAELSRRLKLPEGTKFFEDDAVSAVALRSRSAFEAAAQTNMLEKLATEKNPLVAIARADDPTEAALIADRARKQGWDKLTPSPAVGDVYGPPEVIKELKNVQAVITNDASMQQLQKTIQKVNSVWATYATSPILTGTSFHARNATGNIINNFLRGLQDPRYYQSAVSRQRQLGKVRRLMAKEGVSWEEALQRTVESPRIRALLNAEKDNNVFSAGFFADLSNNDLEKLTGAKAPLKEQAGRALTDNPAVRSGRKLGDLIENNARMAHFEWAMDKYGGDVARAAKSVKETLFDYADLTPFERNTMRSFNRFYTFQRKNLALQFHVLAENPWRTKLIVRGKDSLTRDDPNAPIPDYARRSGFGVADFLGVPKGTEGVAFTYDTPIDAATKTLDPLARAASMLPGIRSVLPPEYRSSAQDLTRSVLNMRTGGQVEMVNFLYETATGKDLYSGKELTGKDADTLNRLAGVFMPLYGKAQGLAKREPGETAELTLLQALVGFQTIPLTDKQRNQIAYVGAQEAQNAITKLKEQGVDVPTYSELVRVGLAPDLSAPSAGTGTRRSSEEVYRDTLADINKSRIRLGAQPTEGTPQTGRKAGKFF